MSELSEKYFQPPIIAKLHYTNVNMLEINRKRNTLSEKKSIKNVVVMELKNTISKIKYSSDVLYIKMEMTEEGVKELKIGK